MKEKKFHYKGWFGLCPVYIDDPHCVAPSLVERHWLLIPLMSASHWIFVALFALASFAAPSYVPMWPIKVTGRLAQPVLFYSDDDDPD